jgi:ribose/xylose/arabinose/galactoside ABC-type transport system permease subunit
MTDNAVVYSRSSGAKSLVQAGLRRTVKFGVLPLLMITAVVLFGFLESRFLSLTNLVNLMRQSTYLAIVSMAQLLVLLTAGIDLSVGSTIALVSVITAITMASILAADPGAVAFAIMAGIGAGFLTGAVMGALNGFGVAVLKVNAFMMTLGMMSIGYGLALTFSGGSPVYGMPDQFRDILSYARPWGIPSPVYVTLVTALFVYVLLNWTRAGRYLYALGSNARAAHLSGIKVGRYTFLAYVVCGLLASVAGLLLTSRVLSGEANMGQDLVLQSIAACVIGSVSLFGGSGRVGNVLLGALFISILTNGMNLIRVDSYLQQVVLGTVLILAISVDRFSERR